MVERPVRYALGLYWMLNDMLTDVALRIKNKLEVDIGKVDDAITICFANKSHEKFSNLCKELELSKKFVPYCTEIIVSKADGNKLHKKVFSRDNKNPQTDSSDHKSKELWVRILLKPDLATYNMTSLNGDIVGLIKKRVIDIAGCLGETVEVKLNGRDVGTISFSTYIDLYFKPTAFHFVNIPRINMKISDDIEICVTLSNGQFQQVSFVNLVNTSHGGDNVDVISNAIAKRLFETIKKKDENSTLNSDENENKNENENQNLNSDEEENPNQDSDIVKNHLSIFLNVKFRNPVFNLPAKDTFDHPRHTRAFTKTFELSEDFLKEVADSPIVKILKSRFGMYVEKENIQIENLKDAYLAGGEHSKYCTLIFVEGNSAESLATTGLGILGRDTFGVFRLQGKLLNVRENSKDSKITDNIIKSMGIQKYKISEGENYAYPLRYGKVMIMTDQDDDGFHIKGLLINLFHCFCPSLLKIEGFLAEFITPCIKVTKEHDQKYFYSTKRHEEWKKTQDNTASDWSTKRYKGLGTFSPEEEGKDFFRNLEKHRKYFIWDDGADEAIDLVFNKKRVDDRKEWLNNYICLELEEQCSNQVNDEDEDEENHDDEDEETHKNYTDFFNKKYIKYCIAALKRTIPSIADGLKPGQRKILFCALKNKLIGITKLETFSKSVDHHSSSNVASIIMGMTRNYVGSNNVNLFIPHGNYGTRGQGGEDQSAPRYLHIELSRITRLIFLDDESSDERGKEEVKPGRYFPIIPMVLVNGCEGIGVGWSTNVPNYHPIHIIKNMMHLIANEGNMEKLPVEMCPWYKGFRGRIEGSQSGDRDYTSYGCIQESNGMLKITELPIHKWTDKYLKFLNSVAEHNAEAKDPFIKGYKKYGDDTSRLRTWSCLTKTAGLSSIVLQNRTNLRKKHADKALKARSELDFVKRYRQGNIILSKDNMQKKDDLVKYIEHQGFETNAEYLASLKLVSLTEESEKALEKELEKAEEESKKVEDKAAATSWLEDLQVLENELLKDKLFQLTA
ncbi:hypothetical protein C1H46_026950 [Malus baccata]|uniref:DNA topoisomerase 2 n=1 Tax=Malus baccata TaxID=106549 RepID=A0A540LM39_MALBA|nr:hypothetical protein C1H46_026950 [Malus baccata]